MTLSKGKFVNEVTSSVSSYFELNGEESVTIQSAAFSGTSEDKNEVTLTLSGAVTSKTLTIKATAFTGDAVVTATDVTVTAGEQA